jgi:acyl carrier protein
MVRPERVVSVMARVFELPEAAIAPDSTRESIEQWDSLGHMSLCVALEEEFAVSFDDRHVSEMTSVAAIVETLQVLSPR